MDIYPDSDDIKEIFEMMEKSLTLIVNIYSEREMSFFQKDVRKVLDYLEMEGIILRYHLTHFDSHVFSGGQLSIGLAIVSVNRQSHLRLFDGAFMTYSLGSDQKSMAFDMFQGDFSSTWRRVDREAVYLQLQEGKGA